MAVPTNLSKSFFNSCSLCFFSSSSRFFSSSSSLRKRSASSCSLRFLSASSFSLSRRSASSCSLRFRSASSSSLCFRSASSCSTSFFSCSSATLDAESILSFESFSSSSVLSSELANSREDFMASSKEFFTSSCVMVDKMDMAESNEFCKFSLASLIANSIASCSFFASTRYM